MKTHAAGLICGAGLWALASMVIGQIGPFRPNWESLANHTMPEWLLDAKFGIYAHWGVYSVPAFETEWYAKRMHQMDICQRDASDIRFTRSKDWTTRYVFCLGLPREDTRVKSLGRRAGYVQKPIAEVALLGSDQKVRCTQEPDALVIDAPAVETDRLALTFKISFWGKERIWGPSGG